MKKMGYLDIIFFFKIYKCIINFFIFLIVVWYFLIKVLVWVLLEFGWRIEFLE